MIAFALQGLALATALDSTPPWNVAPTPITDPTSCTAWRVSEYWVGMTREQAEAIRPTRPPSRQSLESAAGSPAIAAVREVPLGDLHPGRLFFDARGRVLEWSYETSACICPELASKYTERLGEPSGVENGRVVWASRGCDTEVVLQPHGQLCTMSVRRLSAFASVPLDPLD